MAAILRIILVVVMATGFFISCGELQRKAEEKVDNLMEKTESLDSLISKEVDKIKQLDSLIIKGHEKVKTLDSLIDKSTSRMDTLVKEKLNPIN